MPQISQYTTYCLNSELGTQLALIYPNLGVDFTKKQQKMTRNISGFAHIITKILLDNCQPLQTN